jgi:F420-dependent oxidoreductase-like protein
MRVPLRVGLHLPNFNFPGVDGAGLFEHLTAMAKTAESSGFSSISVMDHLHQIAVIGPREHNMLEGTTALGALAAVTDSVSLGLIVGGVTYRNPALLAKATTTIDIVSKGRAWFGIGAAWNEEEHNAYGIDFPSLKIRFEHLEDTLNIARRMFTQSESSYEGTHHTISGALNNPQPIRGDIPILIGGSGERKTLRMVAQYADGCNLFGDVERVKHLLGVLEGHCQNVGRDSGEIQKTRMGSLIIAATEEEAQAKADRLGTREGSLIGSPESIAEQVQPYKDAGLDGFVVSIPDSYDLEVIELAGKALSQVFPA